MNNYSEISKMQTRRQLIKQLKVTTGKNQFEIKILMDKQVSLMKLLSIFAKITSHINNNPTTSSKTYWSIIKVFVNGKKATINPPSLIDEKLVKTLRKKLIL